jgi:hypothetical protein
MKRTEERMRKKLGMLVVNMRQWALYMRSWKLCIKTLNLRQMTGMASRMKLVKVNKGDFKEETSLTSCITCFLLFIFFHIFWVKRMKLVHKIISFMQTCLCKTCLTFGIIFNFGKYDSILKM